MTRLLVWFFFDKFSRRDPINTFCLK
jgi:hypothetical protein